MDSASGLYFEVPKSGIALGHCRTRDTGYGIRDTGYGIRDNHLPQLDNRARKYRQKTGKLPPIAKQYRSANKLNTN